MTLLEQCRSKIARGKDYPIEFHKYSLEAMPILVERLEIAIATLKHDDCGHTITVQELEAPIEAKE